MQHACRPVVLAKHAARPPSCPVVPASFSTTTWLRSCREAHSHFHGNTVMFIPITAVLPLSPLPFSSLLLTNQSDS